MAEAIPIKLSKSRALSVIRELAADTSKIVIVSHGRKRAGQRRITRRQIELCCQKGTITEGPFLNVKGHWQCNMYRRAAGEEVTCVVVIDWATRLVIITVY